MTRKIFPAGLVIAFALILFLAGNKSFGNNAPDPDPGYSLQPDTNIGAWYDEAWQASGFYRLERIGTTETFRYKYTTNPVTLTAPTFTKNGAVITNTTEPSQVHAHDYNYTTPGASLPQDIVVTEWKCTGHVHFASGM
jgi:hypothetical protein